MTDAVQTPSKADIKAKNVADHQARNAQAKADAAVRRQARIEGHQAFLASLKTGKAERKAANVARHEAYLASTKKVVANDDQAELEIAA